MEADRARQAKFSNCDIVSHNAEYCGGASRAARSLAGRGFAAVPSSALFLGFLFLPEVSAEQQAECAADDYVPRCRCGNASLILSPPQVRLVALAG